MTRVFRRFECEFTCGRCSYSAAWLDPEDIAECAGCERAVEWETALEQLLEQKALQLMSLKSGGRIEGHLSVMGAADHDEYKFLFSSVEPECAECGAALDPDEVASSEANVSDPEWTCTGCDEALPASRASQWLYDSVPGLLGVLETSADHCFLLIDDAETGLRFPKHIDEFRGCVPIDNGGFAIAYLEDEEYVGDDSEHLCRLIACERNGEIRWVTSEFEEISWLIPSIDPEKPFALVMENGLYRIDPATGNGIGHYAPKEIENPFTKLAPAAPRDLQLGWDDMAYDADGSLLVVQRQNRDAAGTFTRYDATGEKQLPLWSSMPEQDEPPEGFFRRLFSKPDRPPSGRIDSDLARASWGEDLFDWLAVLPWTPGNAPHFRLGGDGVVYLYRQEDDKSLKLAMYGRDGKLLADKTLSEPWFGEMGEITVDRDGNVYVLMDVEKEDNRHIVRFARDGGRAEVWYGPDATPGKRFVDSGTWHIQAWPDGALLVGDGAGSIQIIDGDRKTIWLSPMAIEEEWVSGD